MSCTVAMGSSLLLALGLSLAESSPPSPEDQAAYREAAEAAGRDAEAQLRLALWCEASGLEAEARRHLALAVLIDPDHAAARALLGQVRRGESWRRPAEVVALAAADPDQAALREQYEGRRSRLDPTADGHWRLALWCEQAGLADETTAHLTAVTRLDPKREAAWKRLGYKKHDGRWMTDAQIGQLKAEAEARSAIEATWRPRLEEWARQLADPAARGLTIAALGEVDHPLLVPAVWSVLVGGRNADRAVAVQVLGQIDARDASRALATLAAFSDDSEVRRLATETLKRRDAREWADQLIRMIRKPIRYSVQPVAGPGSTGELFVEGERYNRRRLYAAPPPPALPMMPGDQLVMGVDGLPVLWRQTNYTEWSPIPFVPVDVAPAPAARQEIIGKLQEVGVDRQVAERITTPTVPNQPPSPLPVIRGLGLGSGFLTLGTRTLEIPVGRAQMEAQQAAASVQEQLRRDVAAIEAYNAPITRLNERVVPVLEDATGARNGDSPDAWRAWWIDQIGMRQVFPQPPGGGSTFTDVVSVQPRPLPIGVFDQPGVMFRTVSCFGQGTPVHTLDGPRPIEDLQVGDLVLGQDASTGALAYRPVVATHHNPPSETFHVRIGGETVVSSAFHRFWVAGRGWVMARELNIGDTIRALGRTAEVEAIEEGPVQPVYNLDVADTRSFFVGELGVLVHDNSLPSTTLAPFDAVPDLAALAEAGGPAAGE